MNPAATKIAAKISSGRRDLAAIGILSSATARDIADFARAIFICPRALASSPLTITPRAGVTDQNHVRVSRSGPRGWCARPGRDDPAADLTHPLRGMGARVAGYPLVRTRFHPRPLLDADGGTARSECR